MPLKFTPKAESEISRGFENLPPGEYPFTVMESGIAESKSEKNPGREMVALKLNVHGPKFDRHIYDYFADWFSEWKLKHFCECVGQAVSYLSGSVDPSENAWKDFQGMVKIGEEKDKKGELRNVVVDYLPAPEQKADSIVAYKEQEPKKAAPAPVTAPAEATVEDDVPF